MAEARVHTIQNNFTGGELSQDVLRRQDLARYNVGMAAAENIILLPQGGFIGRWASRFVARVAFPLLNTRLVPFNVADGFEFALEFGDEYIRFYTLNGRIQYTSTAITGAADNGGGLIRITSVAHGLDAAKKVWQVDVTGPTFVDETPGFNDATDANFTVFPATEAVGDYVAIGFEQPFSSVVFDNANGTAGVGGVVTWEYWNGFAWTALSGVSDGTTGFTAAVADGQVLSYTLPTDWVAHKLNGVHAYYIRARITTVYTTNPIYDQGFIRGTSVPVNIFDVVGTVEANGDFFATVIDEDTFDLQGSVFTNTYVSGGEASRIVQIPSPYSEAEVFDIQATNLAGVLYIDHENHEPATLTRESDLDWALADILFIDGPYLDENISPTTITPSATTGNITLTASAALFDPLHVGSLWRIKVNATFGYVRITGFTSPTVVNAEVIATLDGTTATTAWREGLWSNFRGFPQTVTVYEQRLVFDGGPAAEQSVVGSSARNVIDMTPGVNPDDAYIFTIGGKDLSDIKFLAPTPKALFAGTTRVEFALRDADNKTLSPDNPPLTRPQSNFGASPVSPVEVDNAVIFVQRNEKKIREFVFSFERDGFTANDITILANEITGEAGIAQLSSMPEPVNLVWAVRGDGVLLSLTRMAEQNITAWVRHLTFGGNDFFRSVATIPHPDGDRDQTWVIVEREINGATQQYVERLDDTLRLDSGLSLDATGSPTVTVSNLEHLEGRTVTPLGDGSVYPDEVVTNGEITLDGPAAELIDVGLAYEPRVVPVSPEAELADGTTQGLPRRIIKVLAFLDETVGLQINGEPIPFRDSSDPMTAAVQPFTGVKRVLNLGWSKGGTDSGIELKQAQPLPFKVLALVLTVEFGDA